MKTAALTVTALVLWYVPLWFMGWTSEDLLLTLRVYQVMQMAQVLSYFAAWVAFREMILPAFKDTWHLVAWNIFPYLMLFTFLQLAGEFILTFAGVYAPISEGFGMLDGVVVAAAIVTAYIAANRKAPTEPGQSELYDDFIM